MTSSPGLCGEAASRPAVECYRRRRQTPTSKTILPPTLLSGQ